MHSHEKSNSSVVDKHVANGVPNAVAPENWQADAVCPEFLTNAKAYLIQKRLCGFGLWPCKAEKVARRSPMD